MTLDLWLDVNNNGVVDPGVDNLVRSTMTDENGQYAFAGLPAGAYLVDVTDARGVLAGMALTDGADATDDYSQVDPYAVTLSSTGGIVSSDFTADFGYMASTPLTISGIVFEDSIKNGAWDAAEILIPGATLSLYRVVDGEWFLVGSTTSAPTTGFYEFTDLPAGEYRVVADVSGTPLSGKFQTTQTATGAVQHVTLESANSANNDFGFYAPPYLPTAVTMAYFSATARSDGAIDVIWGTAMELDHVGFNLYRGASLAGPWERLNSALITPQFPGATTGADYTWLDAVVEPDTRYTYLLEDVDTQGVSTFHGPVSITASPPAAVTLVAFGAGGNPFAGLSLLLALASLALGSWKRRRALL
ncbi:MAG: Serine-aspartate repeat-containing protein D precursor [bacterium ADurb.Bin429]|nr:MAG: Serine-aspartate repeat-containing protein D precursor [bacterium ADurb.Bin429]